MKTCVGIVVLSMLATGNALAGAWTTYTLPTATDGYKWGLSHTDDGRFVYGNSGTFWQQDNFGAGAYTTYANSPSGLVDPSFIDVHGGTVLLGAGGWGASTLSTFGAGNAGSTFTNTTISLQNFGGRLLDENSALIVGGNGSMGAWGASNNLTYVTLDGLNSKTIINDISEFSCGFTLDGSGNLYVGDNDDGYIYYFSKAQLDAAIAGSALEMADGAFVADFGSGGDMASLAVDANGVLWGAGWAHNGIVSYDQADSTFYNWTPGHASSSYIVDHFSAGGSNYVGFVSNSGIGPGSEVLYGFADVDAIPEPGTVTLMVVGFGGMVWFRKRRKYFFRR